MKKVLIVLIAVAMLGLVACSTNVHVIGKGAQGNDVQTARQWYALFGLIPINEVDTNAMAGDAENYTITTEQTFIDGVICCFTCYVTVTCRTVEVQK